MGVLINCKKIQQEILAEAKARAEGRKSSFLIVNDGTSEASAVYVRNKVNLCKQLGIETTVVDTLNPKDIWFHDYVMVQLPCNEENASHIKEIPWTKDVDCLTPRNLGTLYKKGIDSRFTPCTPRGIMELIIRTYGPNWLEGKDVVIVGRSNIVGRPLALFMEQFNATVTLCHSRTLHLKKKCKRADVLVCAIGKPKFFDKSYVKEGAVVIDVGINRDQFGKLCGDVDTEDVLPVCSAITPVPGGVGLLTTASLMLNLTAED